MNLRIAPSAHAEIIVILDKVRLDSKVGADAIAKRLDEIFPQIAEYPRTGRVTNRRGMRCINARPYPYLVFYRMIGLASVEVVAVRHGARSPRSMPARPR